VKIDLVGNQGTKLILIESHESVPDFNEYFGQGEEEHGKDTYKKGLPRYLRFNDTISLLFN